MVAGYVSIYLEDPGVQDFSRKTQLRSPAVHYRSSPVRGLVHWEVQSVRGPVHWEGQSSERSSPLKVQCGESTSQVQFSERGSPLRGPVLWEGQSMRGAVQWERQSIERFSVVRGRRLQRREFCEKFGDKRNQKVNSTRRYRSCKFI